MNVAGYLLSVLLFIAPVHWQSPGESAADNFCDLKGSVCIVDNPQQAYYKVYVEESEGFADMLVFKTDNSLFADRPGIWYFVKNRGFADFTIYLVDAKEKADFSIYYTTYESMAGCGQ